jgi:magnesium-transporting ATPase (P-type)
MGAAVAIFIAKVIQIWARNPGTPSNAQVLSGFIDAFILAVTIVVVAIPEGLPLAVTISLAFSTKKMYQDMCFIRVLAACETMGNATNICSDKTGTLTENRMTVVEGYFGDKKYNQDEFNGLGKALSPIVKTNLVEQICINRTAYLVFKDSQGKDLHAPQCIGNKTEGALIDMCRAWGFEYEVVMKENFNPDKDKVYAFNSSKKRSTAVLFRKDGSVRVYSKGASEWILKDCTKVTNTSGGEDPMTPDKVQQIEGFIEGMANEALRTLLLAHRDFPSASALPADWEENPPDNAELVCDCVVGIIDPLRSDVKEAVKTAQEAGVIVRMITGDNIATASAIARQCGILGPGDIAIEGPTFRKMTPKAVDSILPRLRVMARSSPDDKYLLVTRLNGHGVPSTKEEWEEKHKAKVGVSWETHKDLLLPGYREEWEETRPDGGDIVGVTGDGTNDAPALKAADVGLAMGITGTKVAQGASDIVILDDKFSSIIKAILWGRSVYDNIRKFLQFQLTVNVVALGIVFIGACAGFGGSPLTAVQMLWVNLVMDTLGALALGTEAPTRELLNRKPYKRSSPLLARPMLRNIAFQSAFQLILLIVLLFAGSDLFNVPFGTVCKRYIISSHSSKSWEHDGNTIKCADFTTYCGNSMEDTCYKKKQTFGTSFSKLEEFAETCLDCKKGDYRHGTIMFNSFIWCQFFNEYTSRNLFDEVNPFRGILSFENGFKVANWAFVWVSIFTAGFQILFVEVFGKFASTSPLPWNHWLITIALGFIGVPIGMFYRFIPVKEDPNTFFDALHGFVKEENTVLAQSPASGGATAVQIQ